MRWLVLKQHRRSALPPAHMVARRSRGFTLVELLVALLVVVLLSIIVATGIPAAINAYRSAVNSANAQVALSTTTTALRDELGFASGPPQTRGGVLYYQCGDGYWASLQQGSKGLERVVYTGDIDDLGTASDPYPLIPNAAVTDDLKVEYDSITYDEATGVFVVSGLEVVNGSGKSLADAGGEYKIKAILMGGD